MFIKHIILFILGMMNLTCGDIVVSQVLCVIQAKVLLPMSLKYLMQSPYTVLWVYDRHPDRSNDAKQFIKELMAYYLICRANYPQFDMIEIEDSEVLDDKEHIYIILDCMFDIRKEMMRNDVNLNMHDIAMQTGVYTIYDQYDMKIDEKYEDASNSHVKQNVGHINSDCSTHKTISQAQDVK